jgi:DNA-binding PadR family transcriptional regulator
MREPIGHFWTARHSQIYPELARLADAGHVSVLAGQGPGPRARKTYTITDSGRQALADWLPQPPAFQPRSELVLKAYAVNVADRPRMANLYQTTADMARHRATSWQAELDAMAQLGYNDPAHPRFGNYAVLKMGVESQRVTHRWAAWLARELRKAGDP